MALLVKSIADMICEQGNEVVNDVIAEFGSRNDVENGKPITYDQLFLFLK